MQWLVQCTMNPATTFIEWYGPDEMSPSKGSQWQRKNKSRGLHSQSGPGNIFHGGNHSTQQNHEILCYCPLLAWSIFVACSWIVSDLSPIKKRIFPVVHPCRTLCFDVSRTARVSSGNSECLARLHVGICGYRSCKGPPTRTNKILGNTFGDVPNQKG